MKTFNAGQIIAMVRCAQDLVEARKMVGTPIDIVKAMRMIIAMISEDNKEQKD